MCGSGPAVWRWSAKPPARWIRLCKWRSSEEAPPHSVERLRGPLGVFHSFSSNPIFYLESQCFHYYWANVQICFRTNRSGRCHLLSHWTGWACTGSTQRELKVKQESQWIWCWTAPVETILRCCKTCGVCHYVIVPAIVILDGPNIKWCHNYHVSVILVSLPSRPGALQHSLAQFCTAGHAMHQPGKKLLQQTQQWVLSGTGQRAPDRSTDNALSHVQS